jgi:hypothetical protein
MKKVMLWTALIIVLAVSVGCGSKPSPYGKYTDPDHPQEGAFDLRPDGKIYLIVDGVEKDSLSYTISGDIITIKGKDGKPVKATLKGNTLTLEEGEHKLILVKEGAATEGEKAAARETIAPQRMAANEASAQANLRMLMTNQITWRQQDADMNERKDFWTYDVSCLNRMFRVDGTTKVQFIDIALAKADAKPADAKLFGGKIDDWGSIKPGPKSGYFFQTMATNEKGNAYNQNEVNGIKAANDYTFAFVAYPAEYGKTGKNTFIINETGTVYKKDTSGQPVLQWPAADPTSAGWQIAE